MYHSLKKITGLDGVLLVYPGHNYGGRKFSTLGEEKLESRLQQVDEESFIGFMEE